MKALISILFLALANISFAEDMRYYDVEVIIIENLSENSKKSEIWPLQVNITPPQQTVKLGQPVLSDWLPQNQNIDLLSSYVELGPSNFQLTKEIEKLTKSKTQRVIFHSAWRQPGLDKHTALPVYFKREIPAMPETKTTNNLAATEQSSQLENNNKGSSEANPTILEGLLRVTLARYLHLEAELTYREKLPEITNNENPFADLDVENERDKIEKQGVIHFKQNRRRIRSNELHYLDHPALGILIRITPYENSEEITNESTTKK